MPDGPAEQTACGAPGLSGPGLWPVRPRQVRGTDEMVAGDPGHSVTGLGSSHPGRGPGDAQVAGASESELTLVPGLGQTTPTRPGR